MNWEDSINDFKIYLTLERSVSNNTIDNYIRDINKVSSYFKLKNINPKKVDNNDLMHFIKEHDLKSHRWYNAHRQIIINMKKWKGYQCSTSE